MLRSIDGWDSEHFAFGGAESSPAAAVSAIAIDNGPDGLTATIPDAHLLFTAQFSRAGADLVLQGEDGKTFAVHDYFASDARARLLSPEGAALSPDVVAALAGPLAPGQFAQAGAPQATAQAVGRVAQVEGGATIIRNGVAMQANTGDAILKGDVLQTVTGSLGVTFNDGSTLNITANSRLVVNEFVYDPKGSQNSQLLDLVQGSLTFISGEVAHSGDMKIGTPVATMGIRGTVGGVTTANDGTVRFYVSQSATGAVILDSRGTIIANVVQDGPLIVVRPVGPLQVLAEELQKSPAQLATELAALQHIVSIKSVGDQLIQQFFQQNPTNNPNPQSTDHPHTQIPDTQIDLKPDPLADNGNNNDGYNPPATAIVTFPPPAPIPGTTPPPDPDPIIVTIPVNLPPVNFGPPVVTASAATVSEEGLSGGIADGTGNPDTTNSATASGTIAATDGDGDSLTFSLGTPGAPLTSNGIAITWVGAGTGTLTGVAGQTTVITIAINPQTGAYTVTLSGPIDHPDGGAEDVKSFDVPVSVTDGTATTVSSLTVTIEDDRPVAVDRSVAVTAGAAAITANIVIILDISGSMDTVVSGDQTRLDLAKQALHNLLTTSRVDINQVMTVPFGSTANAHTVGEGSVWTSASEADTFIQDLNTSGGTNYVAAINETMGKWGTGNNGPGSADKTLVYFISDGEPNPGLSGPDTTAWETFLANHHVDVSNAVGISPSVGDTALRPIAWAAPNNTELLPINLDDANDLNGTLQGTVENVHNIFHDGETADAGSGADGGHIASIEIDHVTYNWDGGTLTKSDGETTAVLSGSSISVETELGGRIDFYFAADGGHLAGDWSYKPPASLAAPTDEIFHYVLTDNDGDHAGANITVTVTADNYTTPPVTADLTFNGYEDVYQQIDFDVSEGSAPARGFILDSLPDANVGHLQISSLNPNDPEGLAQIGVEYSADSSVYFLEADNWNGTATFQYHAVGLDGAVDVTPGTITLNWAAVNDTPVAAADHLIFASDNILSAEGSSYISFPLEFLAVNDDPDGGDLFTNAFAAENGTFGPPALGGVVGFELGNNVVYQLGPQQPVPFEDSFVYRISNDGTGETTSEATVTLSATASPTLEGGAGSDIIVGGLASETMIGHGGADGFVFLPANGHDTITDFTPGVDKIVIANFDPGAPLQNSGMSAEEAAFLLDPNANTFDAWKDGWAVDTEANSVTFALHYDSGSTSTPTDTVTVANTGLDSLTVNDFIVHNIVGVA